VKSEKITLSFVIHTQSINDSVIVPILSYKELGKAIKDGYITVSKRRAKQIIKQFKKRAEQELKERKLDYVDIDTDYISVRCHGAFTGYLTFYEEIRIRDCEDDKIKELLRKWSKEKEGEEDV